MGSWSVSIRSLSIEKGQNIMDSQDGSKLVLNISELNKVSEKHPKDPIRAVHQPH